MMRAILDGFTRYRILGFALGFGIPALLAGCGVALAQGAVPVATASTDPLATTIGALGGLGGIGVGGAGIWLGRMFQQVISLGESINSKLDHIAEVIETIEYDIDAPTEERQKRRVRKTAGAKA